MRCILGGNFCIVFKTLHRIRWLKGKNHQAFSFNEKAMRIVTDFTILDANTNASKSEQINMKRMNKMKLLWLNQINFQLYKVISAKYNRKASYFEFLTRQSSKT